MLKDNVLLGEYMLRNLVFICTLFFSGVAAAESIDSINSGKKVELIGFDCVDERFNMIEWLGLGSNYRSFVISDVEEALYGQQPNSQLLKVECFANAEFLTAVLPNEGDVSKAVLTKFSVIFPLKATVNLSGDIWVLTIDQKYLAENLETPENIKLRKTFTVKGSEPQ